MPGWFIYFGIGVIGWIIRGCNVLEIQGGQLYSGELKTAGCFLLFVVKPMGSHSSKLIQSVCQCFRTVVLLVSDRVEHYHIPNSVILTRR